MGVTSDPFLIAKEKKCRRGFRQAAAREGDLLSESAEKRLSPALHGASLFCVRGRGRARTRRARTRRARTRRARTRRARVPRARVRGAARAGLSNLDAGLFHGDDPARNVRVPPSCSRARHPRSRAYARSPTRRAWGEAIGLVVLSSHSRLRRPMRARSKQDDDSESQPYAEETHDDAQRRTRSATVGARRPDPKMTTAATRTRRSRLRPREPRRGRRRDRGQDARSRAGMKSTTYRSRPARSRARLAVAARACALRCSAAPQADQFSALDAGERRVAHRTLVPCC